MLFGLHLYLTERTSRRVSEPRDKASFIGLQLAVCTVLASAIALPNALPLLHQAGPGGLVEAARGVPASIWGDIAYMGVFTTAFTLVIEVEAMREVSSSLAAIIYAAEPLWGAALAWVVLGERWGLSGWAGAAMIIGASLSVQLAPLAKDESA